MAYEYCHHLCLCVCVSVCVSILLVRAITNHPIKLGSPNLDQKMQNILPKVPIVLGADSRSNLTSFQNPVYLHSFGIFEIFVRPAKNG